MADMVVASLNRNNAPIYTSDVGNSLKRPMLINISDGKVVINTLDQEM